MFSTQVNISHSPFEITYSDRILTLGSCFAENIGNKLLDAYFLTFINPFGVMYNPMSVCQSIRYLLGEKEFTKDDLFQSGSLWNSFAHSSAYSATNQEETLQKINSRLLAARYFFKETNVMMITLGTAWVFELADNGKLVSNCHKQPADRFNRRRLSMDEIVREFTSVLGLLHRQNPQMQFIFTVSPIRHWKDGAHENTVSKSTLHLAVEVLEKQFDCVHYFPAYELMMDEMRDYRYYAADMLHPSEVAVDYIWLRFAETYFSSQTQNMRKELEQLRSDLNHRPIHPETEEYRLFQLALEKRKTRLIQNYPFLKERF